MVESSAKGDGVVRNTIYAKFRTDKPASAGYSAELISTKVDPKDYDDLKVDTNKSFLDYFAEHVTQRPNDSYLGTRELLGQEEVDGKKVNKFGSYKWQSYKEVDDRAQNLARGMNKMNLAVETEGDGKKWHFVGIWAKNRQEWTTTHIANMYMTYTTIGFFDSMGVSSVDFILE
jgi:long-subunit acyl-CoA synthetase (AMP-forming)